MPEREASVLFVEGNDDLHAIKHLLLRHGVDCRQINVEIKRGASDADAGAGAGGVHRVLEAMHTAIMTSAGRSVGFVLDADEVAQDRWRAVCGRIEGVGVSLPNDIPGGGFVAEAEHYKARFGVWLMPDNQRSGALEEFLQDLVETKDELLSIARESTRRAKQRGAKFHDTARSKAVLHAWLAWQERPGLPYGSAIAARYFNHDSSAALAFVDWFKRVFDDSSLLRM